jgi:hypothetical protein
MMAAPEVVPRRLGENRAHARELGPPSAPGDVTDPDRQGLPILPFSSKAAWRAWLAANHDTSEGLWLKIAKAGSANDSVTYAEALDVALCHGWIDGQKGAYDEAWWLQRFTPRGPRSKWSRGSSTDNTNTPETGKRG